MSTSVASQRADRLARVGLLGTYTMLARRAARPESQPVGRAGGPTPFHAESFGWRAQLPGGWLRQSLETLHVVGRGVILFQDLEVLTPEGVRLRIGSVVEPSSPSDVALDELVRVVGGQSGGRIVACEPADDDSPWRDLTIFGHERTLAVMRVAVAGRRVLCADAWLDTDGAAGDDIVRDFFESLVLTPTADPLDTRPSGTYRSSVVDEE
jgi:hypothetical protein